jgi:hypothetical protein
MIRHWAGRFLSSLSWLAVAYLGYWLAELAESAAVSLAAGATGFTLLWRLTPWRVQLLPLGRDYADFQLWARIQWPLVIAADLLLLLAAWLLARRSAGANQGAGVFRLSFLMGGFWVAIHRVWQLGHFGLGGPDRALRQLLNALLEARHAVMLPAVLLVLATIFTLLGFRVVKGVFVQAPQANESFGRRLLGTLPVLAVAASQTAIAAAAAMSPRAFRTTAPAWILAGPLLVALALILLALWRSPPRLSPPLASKRAAVAVAVAVTLATGLANAEQLRLWWSEGALACIRTQHYDVLYDAGHWSRSQAEAFASQRESRFSLFEKRLPWPEDGVRLRIVVYPGSSALFRAVRGFSSFQLDRTTVRVAADGGEPFVSQADDARLYLGGAWGPAKSPVVATWVARWLVGEWQERSLAEWAALLRHEGDSLSLAELVEESNHVALPPSYGEAVGGAWIEQVFERSQIGAVRQLYESVPEKASLDDLAQRLGRSPAELEASWEEWIARTAPQDEARRAPHPRGFEFLRGMSLKPTELPAPLVERELPRLQQLGNNSVALVTHVHSRGQNRIQYHVNAASEDERLIRAIRAAHGLGMHVLLKPHVYEGTEGFAGNICIEDAASRAVWMESYRKLILHYARIAQDEGVALFSVGNELGCLTKYEREWRVLIGDVRKVYSGSLTYAANWGEEFETLRFWSALDFIGLNNYYPLTESPGQGLPEMLVSADKSAQTIASVQQRWRLPVVFTEVGYPSVKGGTFRPWAPPSRVPDVTEQAAGYEAILRTFAAKPWLHGMFWWAWHDGEFSPTGKPAEETLRTWYRNLAENKTLSSSRNVGNPE